MEDSWQQQAVDLHAGPDASRRAICRRLSDVRPEPVRWLWRPHLALGKTTLLAGNPGLGKSTLTLDLAARVTRGGGWPDDPEARPAAGGVVMLSAEDDPADTIRPRMDVAGADPARVTLVEAVRAEGGRRMLALDRDIEALEEAIERTDACRLVIIDPVSAYLGSADSHNNAEVRRVLGPLGDLARRRGVAMLLVTHLNKNAAGPAIYRGIGSIAFVAAVRCALMVARDPDDSSRQLLIPVKSNIGADGGALAYRLAPVEGTDCCRVEWADGWVDVTADQALTPAPEPGGASTLELATMWLASALADGPRSAREIEEDAREVGISAGTLRRAKAGLGVCSRKGVGTGAWQWSLPARTSVVVDQGAESQGSERLAHLGLWPAGDLSAEDRERLSRAADAAERSAS
ncbi:MAG: AAA family ATPase [Phycisphaerales bacterium JB039]